MIGTRWAYFGGGSFSRFAVGIRVVFSSYWFRPVCGIRVNRLPVKTHRYRDLIDFFFFFFHAVRKHKRIPFERVPARFRLPASLYRRPWLHRGFICERRGKDEEENAGSTSFDTRVERDVFNSRDDDPPPKIRRDSPYVASSSAPRLRSGFLESWVSNSNTLSRTRNTNFFFFCHVKWQSIYLYLYRNFRA